VHSRIVEIVVGIFVAIGLTALFFLAMNASNLASYSGDEGFEIVARFENIGGLKVRSPVAMAGVKVGSVSNIRYDIKDLVAVVTMTIDAEYLGEKKDILDENDVKQAVQFSQLPSETSASIYTAGLLGEQYISLQPFESADEEDEPYMAVGGEIVTVNSALVLEEVIGKLVFSITEGGGDSKDE
jgi:phospholipid/cholesterol/gamma-HCH transport system substrate-binding protein